MKKIGGLKKRRGAKQRSIVLTPLAKPSDSKTNSSESFIDIFEEIQVYTVNDSSETVVAKFNGNKTK